MESPVGPNSPQKCTVSCLWPCSEFLALSLLCTLHLVFENYPIDSSELFAFARKKKALFRERVISNFIFLLQESNKIIVFNEVADPEF